MVFNKNVCANLICQEVTHNSWYTNSAIDQVSEEKSGLHDDVK